MCYFTCPFTTPNSNSHSQQKTLPKSAILSLLLTKSVSIYKVSIDCTFYISMREIFPICVVY